MGKRVLTGVAAFCLAVFCWADKTESEPNNSRFDLSVQTIAFNENLRGGLDGGYGAEAAPPQDCWEFHGTAGYSYRFTAVPSNYSLQPLNLDLAIEDSSGTTVALANARGDNQTEILNWICSATGTYYLVIYEGSGFINPYAYYDTAAEEIPGTGVDDWRDY